MVDAKTTQHYSDMLKAQLFAEVVAALRAIVDLDNVESFIVARTLLKKIDSNELLKG